jgi:hypothetical protein
MVIAEAIGPDQFRERVKIYATDLDEAALQTARAGLYDAQALADVPDRLRDLYFESAGTAGTAGTAGKSAFRRDLRRQARIRPASCLASPACSLASRTRFTSSRVWYSGPPSTSEAAPGAVGPPPALAGSRSWEPSTLSGARMGTHAMERIYRLRRRRSGPRRWPPLTEFFVGGLQFLVGRLELLVGGLQFLVE